MSWITISFYILGAILLLAGILVGVYAFFSPKDNTSRIIIASFIAGFLILAGIACLIWTFHEQFAGSNGLENIRDDMTLYTSPYQSKNKPEINDPPHLLAADYIDDPGDRIYGVYGYRFVRKNGVLVTDSTNTVWNTEIYTVLDDITTKPANLGFKFRIDVPPTMDRGDDIFVELYAKYSKYNKLGIVYLQGENGSEILVGTSTAVLKELTIIYVEEEADLLPVGLKAIPV